MAKGETEGRSEPEPGTFRDRLAGLIQSCGGVSTLARLADVSESAVRKWRDGASEPSLSHLTALAKGAGISVGWLASGSGAARPHQGVEERGFPGPEYDLVPLYDVEASAGGGAYVEEHEPVKATIAFSREWLLSQMLDANVLASVTARGDSMQPTILNGDTLLLDRSQNRPAREGLYVIRRDDQLLAKRLQPLFNGDLEIRSDNEAYTRQIVPARHLDQVNVVGRIVWIGRRV